MLSGPGSRSCRPDHYPIELAFSGLKALLR